MRLDLPLQNRDLRGRRLCLPNDQNCRRANVGRRWFDFRHSLCGMQPKSATSVRNYGGDDGRNLRRLPSRLRPDIYCRAITLKSCNRGKGYPMRESVIK